MPLPIPTLTTLRSNIEADINSRLKGADSRLRRNVLAVLSWALANMGWGIYVFQQYVAKQRLPDTADDDQLDRFGGLHGVTRSQAAFSAGTVTLTGAVGKPVPSGTALQTGDSVGYTTQGDVAIGGDGTVVATVQAAVAGAAGDQATDTQLTFISPVSGVNAVATVITLSGGLDLELDDYYRGRIIDHLQAPPQGGSLDDYKQWARQLPGVTRAWARVDWVGAGTVGIVFVFDGRDSIIPTANDVTAMQALLDSKKPGNDTVYAVAAILNPMALTIALSPATQAAKDAISAELADLFSREGQPGATIPLSHIDGAIELGNGAGDFRRTVPAAPIANGNAQITTLGVITWAAW
jgi:uncharacterized phage protein gp47/JayE